MLGIEVEGERQAVPLEDGRAPGREDRVLGRRCGACVRRGRAGRGALQHRRDQRIAAVLEHDRAADQDLVFLEPVAERLLRVADHRLRRVEEHEEGQDASPLRLGDRRGGRAVRRGVHDVAHEGELGPTLIVGRQLRARGEVDVLERVVGDGEAPEPRRAHAAIHQDLLRGRAPRRGSDRRGEEEKGDDPPHGLTLGAPGVAAAGEPVASGGVRKR